MRRWIVGLLVIGGCTPPAVVPAPAEPLSWDALANSCFRLLREDGRAIPGRFWSDLVRLDTARSTRWGRFTMRDLDDYVLVSLTPASPSLERDTLRRSSHWAFVPPERLKLMRTTGYVGESITLALTDSGFVGERERWDDVVLPNEQRRFQRVLLRREACPAPGP